MQVCRGIGYERFGMLFTEKTKRFIFLHTHLHFFPYGGWIGGHASCGCRAMWMALWWFINYERHMKVIVSYIQIQCNFYVKLDGFMGARFNETYIYEFLL